MANKRNSSGNGPREERGSVVPRGKNFFFLIREGEKYFSSLSSLLVRGKGVLLRAK